MKFSGSNILFILSLFIVTSVTSFGSVAQGVNEDPPDFIVLDSNVSPQFMSTENTQSVVTVDFGIRVDLLSSNPKELSMSWMVTFRSNVNVGEATLTLGPFVTRPTEPYEYVEVQQAQLLTGKYIVIHADELFQGKTNETDVIPDDRYSTLFEGTLFQSGTTPLKIAMTSGSGPILAVFLTKSNKEKRCQQAEIVSQNALSSYAGSDSSFVLRKSDEDQVGYIHSRYDQYYQGVRVFGGEVISHYDEVSGKIEDITDGSKKNIVVDPTPQINSDQALLIAHKDINPMGPYSTPPSNELVVFRTADDKQDVLAYRVHSELENQFEISHLEHIIDATTGVILAKWPTLRSTAAVGTGKTLYYGNETLDTNSVAGGSYELKDKTRAANPWNRVLATNSNESNLYVDTDNTWGDGNAYNSSNGVFSENGETSAADVAYATQKSYDYFNTVLGHRGQDDANSAVKGVVHVPSMTTSAAGTIGVMFFKDNPTPATSLDIVGHEYTHGVTQALVNFTYTGETAGLDEGTSNIFGTMIEFFAKPGIADWVECQQISSVACAHQRLDKPSLAGDGSADFWGAGVGSLEAHKASGVARHFFYYLVNGVSTSGNNTSPYLPSGMTPIAATFNNSKKQAAEIWHRALRFYMTNSTNYNGARLATAHAATDLGYSSSKVMTAWKAVNVNRPDLADPPCDWGNCQPLP